MNCILSVKYLIKWKNYIRLRPRALSRHKNEDDYVTYVYYLCCLQFYVQNAIIRIAYFDYHNYTKSVSKLGNEF